MLRAITLFVMSFTLVAWGQEGPRRQYLVAFDSADADLGTASAVPASTASQPLANTAIASINVSSSRDTSASEPALMRVSNPGPIQPAILKSTTNLPERPEPSVRQRRLWWALTAAQHGTATFDAWSTRKSISSGNGYERNPLMKPFADSAAIYPVIQAVPLGLDFISQRMMRSRHGFIRKTWWVPQTIAIAGFTWSGVNNLRVAEGK